jgi:1-deoxy-D-xylulose-5-phosphate reductoisomerase
MGAKISVDSATLMNKGLEIIEARWLFDLESNRIDVIVHPQSIVHSMVEFIDGSVLGQLGVPSMELPIQYALSWPERWLGPESYFVDWLTLPPLSFEQPDLETFPCLQLAREALTMGGNAPAILSTANDVCVEEFLSGNISFNGIPKVIAHVMSSIPWKPNPDLDSVLETVNLTKIKTTEFIKSLG